VCYCPFLPCSISPYNSISYPFLLCRLYPALSCVVLSALSSNDLSCLVGQCSAVLSHVLMLHPFTSYLAIPVLPFPAFSSPPFPACPLLPRPPARLLMLIPFLPYLHDPACPALSFTVLSILSSIDLFCTVLPVFCCPVLPCSIPPSHASSFPTFLSFPVLSPPPFPALSFTVLFCHTVSIIFFPLPSFPTLYCVGRH
jgi:hypothetical protein